MDGESCKNSFHPSIVITCPENVASYPAVNITRGEHITYGHSQHLSVPPAFNDSIRSLYTTAQARDRFDTLEDRYSSSSSDPGSEVSSISDISEWSEPYDNGEIFTWSEVRGRRLMTRIQDTVRYSSLGHSPQPSRQLSMRRSVSAHEMAPISSLPSSPSISNGSTMSTEDLQFMPEQFFNYSNNSFSYDNGLTGPDTDLLSGVDVNVDWLPASENLNMIGNQHMAFRSRPVNLDVDRLHADAMGPLSWIFGAIEEIKNHGTSETAAGRVDTNGMYGPSVDTDVMGFRPVGTPAVVTASTSRRISGKDGQKLFQCELCSATFTTRHNREYHTNAHLGNRPYECSICGSGFAAPATMKRHEKTCKRTRGVYRSE